MFELLRESLGVYSQIRDEIKLLFDEAKKRDPSYANFAIGQLHFFSERCQSMNLLLQDGKLWDCDILMRSALECATRFLFVSVAEDEERVRRIEEYTYLLNEIEDLQRSEKTRTAAEQASDPDMAMLLAGAVPSAERLIELRQKWPKPKRAALLQKWSFSEMARTLTGVHRKEVDLRPFGGFLHAYAVSSHLIHADQTAMNLTWERRERPAQERDALVAAHTARLITQPVSILFICWRALAFAVSVPARNESVVRALLDLQERSKVYHKAFADSQRAYYK
ncbi:DUF5677 domain-containing protein [Burkholderia vietnamiensis]|uniref:DUF5677 domain-containing protein n=1 Tax=Burkholderia vietnamiensis TaxID=60552 RepID=UPI0007526514|nr:DUF5677 domain-containing protein [Burkholderia vietnamiensis]KVR98551.1 hypothetical protein WK28_05685 [Burkholderia vietnamiensis]